MKYFNVKKCRSGCTCLSSHPRQEDVYEVYKYLRKMPEVYKGGRINADRALTELNLKEQDLIDCHRMMGGSPPIGGTTTIRIKDSRGEETFFKCNRTT